VVDSGRRTSTRNRHLASKLRAVNEDSMSTQPSPITPRGRRQSAPEAPVNSEYAARFLNMHPKTVLRRLVKGHSQLTQLGVIGSAGIFIFRS